MRLTLQTATRLPRWPFWAVALAVLWLGLVAAALLLSRAFSTDIALCPFKIVTHIPCPTCGMTRMSLAALRLDIAAAFAFNPLAFVVTAVAGILLAFRFITARRVVLHLTRRQRIAAGIIAAAAVLANWAYLIRYVG